MNGTDKAIKAGENILDGMRFDNLDQQRRIVNALKRYRKTKAKDKDLTLEQRIILLEIRARGFEATPERFRKEITSIYVLLLFCLLSIMFILIILWAK